MKNEKATIRRLISYTPHTGDLRWKISRGKYKTGNLAGSIDNAGYVRMVIGGRKYLGHRVAWMLYYREWPKQDVWHVNGDRSDQRIANLRLEAPKFNAWITQKRLKQLLDYDTSTGLFRWRVNHGRMHAGSIAGYKGTGGYWQIMIDRRLLLAHRLAWLYVVGRLPKAAQHIDHINRDKLDNRICNLRIATPSQNACNSTRRNPLGMPGANFDKAAQKFRVRVSKDGKRTDIGLFGTAKQASAAYVAAVTKLHGEFSRHGRNRWQTTT